MVGGRTAFGVLALAVAVVAAVVGLVSAAGIGGGDLPGISLASVPGDEEPVAYDSARRGEFEARAATGASHVVFANSPGGATATAERVARFRDEIEAAASGSETDPDLLEAMVYLESAGRPEVIAGRDPALASGLTQIVASTGVSLLGMRIDLSRSRALTRAAQRALTQDKIPKVEKLLAARARIDERFDPREALEGAVRYLEIARGRFGADDLAVVSYHMGIGNLENVIGAYTASNASGGRTGEVVAANDLTYARLFFDSSPLRNPDAWDLLSGFGDESSEYYWKVLASREVMRLYREDRGELRRLERLHAAKATAEEVFHPRTETEAFDDPEELAAGWRDGDVVPIPDGEELGYVVGEQLAEVASELEADPALYRGLRPEALEVLVRMAGWVRVLNGGAGSLTVTSAVRDREYQRELGNQNPEATDAYSLHTTGWSFDVLRDYESDRQAGAFQFVLDRLQALGVIDYAVEPEAIHVTVSGQTLSP
ncbi:MAG: transglycosylase SLT domain-containing protein [Solirubrobacterales bacterium]